MARVKGAMMTRKHRNKVLGLAKGYWGNKSRHYKMANEQMFAYRLAKNRRRMVLLRWLCDGYRLETYKL